MARRTMNKPKYEIIKKNKNLGKVIIYDEIKNKYISLEDKEFIKCKDRYDTKKWLC